MVWKTSISRIIPPASPQGGGRLCVIAEGTKAVLWDPLKRKETLSLSDKGKRVTAMALSADGSTLAFATNPPPRPEERGDREAMILSEGTVELLDLASHKSRVIRRTQGAVTGLLALSDGKRFVVAEADSVGLTVIDDRGHESVTRDAGAAITALAASRDGRRFGLGLTTGELMLFDLESAVLTPLGKEDGLEIRGIVFSPDETRLIAGHARGLFSVEAPRKQLPR